MKTRKNGIQTDIYRGRYFPFFSQSNKSCDEIILSYIPPADIHISVADTNLPKGYTDIHLLGALLNDAEKLGWHRIYSLYSDYRQASVEVKEVKLEVPASSMSLPPQQLAHVLGI